VLCKNAGQQRTVIPAKAGGACSSGWADKCAASFAATIEIFVEKAAVHDAPA